MTQRRKGKDPWVCTECGARTFGAWSKPVPGQATLGPTHAKRAQKVLNDPARLTWPAVYRKAVGLLETSGAVRVRGIEGKEIVLKSVMRELLCQACYDRATVPLFGPPTKTELERRRKSAFPVSKLPNRTRRLRSGRERRLSARSIVVAATSPRDGMTLDADRRSRLRAAL